MYVKSHPCSSPFNPDFGRKNNPDLLRIFWVLSLGFMVSKSYISLCYTAAMLWSIIYQISTLCLFLKETTVWTQGSCLKALPPSWIKELSISPWVRKKTYIGIKFAVPTNNSCSVTYTIVPNDAVLIYINRHFKVREWQMLPILFSMLSVSLAGS